MQQSPPFSRNFPHASRCRWHRFRDFMHGRFLDMLSAPHSRIKPKIEKHNSKHIFKFPDTGGSLASMLSCSCLWGGGQVIVALGLWRRRLKRTLNTPPPPQRWKQTRKHIRGAVAPRTGTFRSARQGTPQKVYILITQVVRE